MACLVSYEGLTFARFQVLAGLMPMTTKLRFQNNCVATRYGAMLLFRAPAFLAAAFALVRPLLGKVGARLRFVAEAEAAEEAAAAELAPDAARRPALFHGHAASAGAGAAAALAWLQRELAAEARGM